MENHEDYYDYDEDSEEWDRGCILGNDCLHHDPEHTSDECFDLEAAESWQREGMRDSEEYRLGRDEIRAEILVLIEEAVKETQEKVSERPQPERSLALCKVGVLESLKTKIKEL